MPDEGLQQAQGSPATRPRIVSCQSHSGANPSWLHLFEDNPQVLLVLGPVNRAITPQFPGLAEILEDLMFDQTLFCFILQKQKLVSGQCTLVLQASQPTGS